ncbi:type II toxin-antitoxin system VapC family toxin [Hydrocarboniphaga sp.]|uniref:type II toxin-antitoxin system VapC family toxin n=1 Tax=Hydrocarboniphaga sp. TaxID=2033016 RepID=UPI00260C16F8|nr:type II toxin-antitoxin system VapC family toxin [Hydrocarboniphaga sp.]
MPVSVYIETSITSYLTSRPSRDVVIAARQAITSEWWHNQRPKYEAYISALVDEEISEGDATAAALRQQAVAGIPSVATTPAAIELAQRLLATKAVPANSVEDALHIAIAATQGAEFLLTWNFKHINNAETRAALPVLSRPLATFAPSCVLPKNLEVSPMMNDPIVEEVRRNRQAHAARYNNDLAAICKALKAREASSGRIVVNRPPRLLPHSGAHS